ncbi:hypothetical protein HY214_00430 [Candidatus Roizmanbacteria bacterium]|nr:hypothetical protein [Candidatus Roizmanbacteria bacterium]
MRKPLVNDEKLQLPSDANVDRTREAVETGDLPYVLTLDEAVSLCRNWGDSGGFLHLLFGGKGLGLVEMKADGLPVPPGFVLTRQYWQDSSAQGNLPADKADRVKAEFEKGADWLETTIGRQLGNPDNPLILAVRSSPIRSMPGAMLTVTNVGINDKTIKALMNKIGKKPALQAYYHLINDISEGQGITSDERISETKAGLPLEAMSETQLMSLVDEAKRVYHDKFGVAFPQDVNMQLNMAIGLVLTSYDSKNAQDFRSKNNLPDSEGTACIIAEIIFGNVVGGGSGVIISRDPETFSDEPVITYRSAAQGKSVVGDNTNTTVTLANFPDDIKDQIENVLSHFKNKSPHGVFDLEFSVDIARRVWGCYRKDWRRFQIWPG